MSEDTDRLRPPRRRGLLDRLRPSRMGDVPRLRGGGLREREPDLLLTLRDRDLDEPESADRDLDLDRVIDLVLLLLRSSTRPPRLGGDDPLAGGT